MSIPKIESIHQKIFEASKIPEQFDMGNWHKQTECGTTHCRAGLVVFLAGDEGLKLEQETDTLFAAMQIYKKSSPIRVPIPRFFESNTEAMADMKRCAEEEVKPAN